MPLQISNRQARRLLISAHGLSKPPTGLLNLPKLIHSMGFVQLDTIRTVSRAHHHILWSRNQNYREPMLWESLKNRELFEHFTHDASILPIELYPVWQWQFDRMKLRMKTSRRWTINAALQADIKARITRDGPLSTHAFGTKIKGKKEMWTRPPHKNALDYLWYIGELATSHRENFTKFYDLPERVIPQEYLNCSVQTERFGWLCKEALKRLTIATPAELQDFWGVASAAQIKTWLTNTSSNIRPIEIEAANGSYFSAFALEDIDIRLAKINPATSRLRILSPFDPLVRNRKRLHRIFDFDYKIEIFVPAAKRKWGYYVYPILEGEMFIGRIEIKADRMAGILKVIKLWKDPKANWSSRQDDKLDAELKRLARFIGVQIIQR